MCWANFFTLGPATGRAGRKISRTNTRPHCAGRVFSRRRLSHTARRMVGISDASTSRGLKEKPPLHGDPAPLPRGPAPARERKTAPVRGSSTPVETFFAPAWGSSTPIEIFFAHAHPKRLIFDHIHRAGAIFLSQRHPKRPPGATQGRYFFHAAPRDDTESPPVWRAPRGMGPGRGAGGWQRGLAGQRADA